LVKLNKLFVIPAFCYLKSLHIDFSTFFNSSAQSALSTVFAGRVQQLVSGQLLVKGNQYPVVHQTAAVPYG
jgi:hypothetical protein